MEYHKISQKGGKSIQIRVFEGLRLDSPDSLKLYVLSNFFVVGMYLWLRNEIGPFAAKNQASNWLTMLVNQ